MHSRRQSLDSEQFQKTQHAECRAQAFLTFGNKDGEGNRRCEIDDEGATEVARRDFVHVRLLLAKVCVEVGGSEGQDHIDQEDQIDQGVDQRDFVATDERRAVHIIENWDRDGYRIVHRKDDNEVRPVLYELAAVAEQDFAVRSYQLFLLLLFFEELINIKASWFHIFFRASLSVDSGTTLPVCKKLFLRQRLMLRLGSAKALRDRIFQV